MVTQMAEPKLCPVCKTKPHIIELGEGKAYEIICYSCYSRKKIMGRGATEQEAVEAWNRRVTDDE